MYILITVGQTSVTFKNINASAAINVIVSLFLLWWLQKENVLHNWKPHKHNLFLTVMSIRRASALLFSAYYLQIWCIWALNLPRPISVCLSLKWMALCQLGLAPSAAVSTLKSEGQRGRCKYWYTPWNHFVTTRDSKLQERPNSKGDDCEFLAEGWGTPLKRQMWLNFSENALFLVIVSEVGLKGCDTEITLPPGV